MWIAKGPGMWLDEHPGWRKEVEAAEVREGPETHFKPSSILFTRIILRTEGLCQGC